MSKYLVLPVHSLGGNWNVVVALIPWNNPKEQAKELLDEIRLVRKLRKDHERPYDLILKDNVAIYVEPTEELVELTFEMEEQSPRTAEVSDEDISEGYVRVETAQQIVTKNVVWWSAYVKNAGVMLETCVVSEEFLKECASCTAE